MLVQLLLGFLNFTEKVHDLALTRVGDDTVGLLDDLFGDRDVATHILRAHLLETLLLLFELLLDHD